MRCTAARAWIDTLFGGLGVAGRVLPRPQAGRALPDGHVGPQGDRQPLVPPLPLNPQRAPPAAMKSPLPLNLAPYTLNPQPSTLNPQPPTLNLKPSTLHRFLMATWVHKETTTSRDPPPPNLQH